MMDFIVHYFRISLGMSSNYTVKDDDLHDAGSQEKKKRKGKGTFSLV